MIYITLLLSTLLAPTTRPAPAPAQAVQMPKVDMLRAVKEGKVYRIQNDEATVNSDHIKRVEFGKGKLVISYSNKTKTAHQPSYTFHLYDAYGIEIASFADVWVFSEVKPGEIRTEEKDFGIIPMDRLLRFSGVVLPADWATPVYLTIEGEEK